MFINFGNNKNTLFCGVHSEETLLREKKGKTPDEITIIIAWVDHSHFELVVRIDSIGEDTVTLRTSFGNTKKDVDTIHTLLEHYIAKCNV